MSDSLSIIGALTGTPQKTQNSYAGAKEVSRQAAVTKPNDGDDFKAAVAKLERTLEADKPLREDVPRGYYLNLVI